MTSNTQTNSKYMLIEYR